MKIKNIFIIIIIFLLILLIIVNRNNNQKYVVVSVHDVHPVFQEELEIIFSELDNLNIKKTILVTPYLNNQDINNYPEFIELIQKQNAEIALHGYTHEKNEFSKSYEEVKENVKKSLNIFNKAFNFKPKGFVPGYWNKKKNTIKALNEFGFEYTTTFTKIIYFNDKEINALPTLMVIADRPKFLNSLGKPYSKICIAFSNKIIRFTIHPGELRANTFNYNMGLLKKVLNKGYIPITYEELKTISLNR